MYSLLVDPGALRGGGAAEALNNRTTEILMKYTIALLTITQRHWHHMGQILHWATHVLPNEPHIPSLSAGWHLKSIKATPQKPCGCQLLCGCPAIWE